MIFFFFFAALKHSFGIFLKRSPAISRLWLSRKRELRSTATCLKLFSRRLRKQHVFFVYFHHLKFPEMPKRETSTVVGDVYSLIKYFIKCDASIRVRVRENGWEFK